MAATRRIRRSVVAPVADRPAVVCRLHGDVAGSSPDATTAPVHQHGTGILRDTVLCPACAAPVVDRDGEARQT
jgi:hypothetical protein